MKKNPSQLSSQNTSDSEVLMAAVEECASDLFSQADNDTQYHKPLAVVCDNILNGRCENKSEETAEQILAWSLDL